MLVRKQMGRGFSLDSKNSTTSAAGNICIQCMDVKMHWMALLTYHMRYQVVQHCTTRQESKGDKNYYLQKCVNKKVIVSIVGGQISSQLSDIVSSCNSLWSKSLEIRQHPNNCHKKHTRTTIRVFLGDNSSQYSWAHKIRIFPGISSSQYSRAQEEAVTCRIHFIQLPTLLGHAL